jgi:hypothetical protein
MQTSGAPEESQGRARVWAVGAWLLGLFVAHAPMWLSGFDRIQGDTQDTRLVHYFLEHGYRWAMREAPHGSLWDLPLFHPERNTGAYSEILIGAGPPYWIWRLLGVPRSLAYAFWLLTISSLNFWAAWVFFRRGLRLRVMAAVFGSLLFAFSSARLSHVVHAQLHAGYLIPLVLLALFRIFGGPGARKSAWVAVFFTAMTLQTYTGFYVAWFLGLGLAVAAAWGVALPALRAGFRAGLRENGRAWAFGAAGSLLALLPLVLHGLEAAQKVGYRDYDQVELYLPRPVSWLHMGAGSVVYGGLSGRGPFAGLPDPYEHAIGFGLLTLGLAAAGWAALRRMPWGLLLGAVSLSLLVLSTSWPGGISLWPLVYLAVPAAKSIRAVSRIGNLLILSVAAGAALWVEQARWRKPLVVAVLIVVLLEQVQRTPSYDRVEVESRVASIAGRVRRDAPAFLYTVPGAGLSSQLDAMEASLESGVPTVNGYSGNIPPGYPFEGCGVSPEEGELLASWMRRHGGNASRIQRIRGP